MFVIGNSMCMGQVKITHFIARDSLSISVIASYTRDVDGDERRRLLKEELIRLRKIDCTSEIDTIIGWMGKRRLTYRYKVILKPR